MDLKNYREQPDEGLFEKIERRLRLRRVARMGGVAAGVLVVAGLALWLSLRESTVEKVAMSKENCMPVPMEGAVMQRDSLLLTVSNTANEIQPADVSRTVSAQSPIPEAAVGGNMETRSGASSVERVGQSASSAGVVKVVPPVQLPQIHNTNIQLPSADLVSDSIMSTEDLLTVVGAEVEAQPSKAGEIPSTPLYSNVLWAPNVIAPASGDDAMRRFKLTATSSVDEFSLVIFNRAGRQVYSSADIMAEWDGRYDGVAVPQGAYVWVARFRDSDGHLCQEKGTVTVIR